MSWAWHIERIGEMIDAYKTLAVKSKEKIQFGKPSLHMDCIEIDVIILSGIVLFRKAGKNIVGKGL